MSDMLFTDAVELVNEYLFDDFFVSQDPTDPGQLVEVEIRGRKVPFYVKRGLSLADREAAKSQAVKTRVKPDGKVEIVSIDEGVFATELMVRCLKSWPFKYRNGNPVKITRENIQAMLSDSVDAVAGAVIKQVAGRQENNAPFLHPSEKTSDEV